MMMARANVKQVNLTIFEAIICYEFHQTCRVVVRTLFTGFHMYTFSEHPFDPVGGSAAPLFLTCNSPNNNPENLVICAYISIRIVPKDIGSIA
jgi:hypothetical protein